MENESATMAVRGDFCVENELETSAYMDGKVGDVCQSALRAWMERSAGDGF